MFDNDHSGSGSAFVYRATTVGSSGSGSSMCVPQHVSYLSSVTNNSQERRSPMNKMAAMTSLALEVALHSDSSNSLPSGSRASRRLREFIPEHKKDGDYWLKRQKNNEAAKRSREKRRVNDVMMSRRIAELSNENKRLRMELDAIRRAYGSPSSPRRLPPQQQRLSAANMPYNNADVGYCMGGGAQRRGSLPNPGSMAVPTSATSLSCSAIAGPPVGPSRVMTSSCDRFGETLPPPPSVVGGLGGAFDERDGSVGCLPGPVRSACAVYSFADERSRWRQMEAAVIPVGYGREGSRALAVANPTSNTSSSKDCGVVALSSLAHLASQAGTAAGIQVNTGMPSLVRHLNGLRTTISEGYFDAENVVSCRGIPDSGQASRRHRVELPRLIFSDVSSCDESDDDGDDVLGDLYKLRSLEERPLNLSTRSGLSPIRNGEVMAVKSCGNTRVFAEYQATAALKSRTVMPVLENLEQMTSAFDLPTSSSRRNYSRNVLESLSKVELQSPEVPPLSSSFLLPSNDRVPEMKGLPEVLTRREILSTTSFTDPFLEGGSCLPKFPFRASRQNLEDATDREMCDEEETQSVAVLSEQVISDAELYTFLRSDLGETPTKARKESGQVLSRPVRGGVPLKLWHKWSSAFSEEIKDVMEGRESDPNWPIHHFQE